MPLGQYENFEDCVRQNSDKENPQAYCGRIEAAMKRAIEEVDKQEAEYRIVKTEKPRQYTLGVVYEPDVPDAHDDAMDAGEIEKAAYDYMQRLQHRDQMSKVANELMESIVKAIEEDTVIRVDVEKVYDDIQKRGLNDMHVSTPFDDELGDVVESYIAPVDMEVGGQHVRKGTWLMGVIWNEEMFQKIQAGERTGFSFEGRGIRV